MKISNLALLAVRLVLMVRLACGAAGTYGAAGLGCGWYLYEL